MLDFFGKSFKCKKCCNKVEPSAFGLDHVGLATTILFECACKDIHTVLKPKTRTIDSFEKDIFDSKRKWNKRNVDYSINVQTVLGAQSAGTGQTECSRLLGIMRISASPKLFRDSWVNIEERIAAQERILCNLIINQNLEDEIEATRLEFGLPPGTRPPISIAVDMGWNKKGSDRTYNADSGQHFCVGMRTGLVVSMVFMNRGWRKYK